MCACSRLIYFSTTSELENVILIGECNSTRTATPSAIKKKQINMVCVLVEHGRLEADFGSGSDQV